MKRKMALIATATSGPPLALSSATVVPNLNADQVEGMEASESALDGDLQSVDSAAAGATQNPLSFGTWGFDSPLRHQPSAPKFPVCSDIVAPCNSDHGVAYNGATEESTCHKLRPSAEEEGGAR